MHGSRMTALMGGRCIKPIQANQPRSLLCVDFDIICTALDTHNALLRTKPLWSDVNNHASARNEAMKRGRQLCSSAIKMFRPRFLRKISNREASGCQDENFLGIDYLGNDAKETEILPSRAEWGCVEVPSSSALALVLI